MCVCVCVSCTYIIIFYLRNWLKLISVFAKEPLFKITLCGCVCVCISCMYVNIIYLFLSQELVETAEKNTGKNANMYNYKHSIGAGLSYAHGVLRVAYRIFLWGRTHISAASRGSGGMLPQKIFYILCWTLT